MAKELWTVTEVLELLEIDEGFVSDLEREEIICPTCREPIDKRQYSSLEVEKLRLAKILMKEMDVNLPGVEIILHMRQNMIRMRKQFDEILDGLARQVEERFKQV